MAAVLKLNLLRRGKNYSLPLDTIVVQDRKSIQCVAGIIGAELSKVDLSTNNIFLECAVFKNHSHHAISCKPVVFFKNRSMYCDKNCT